MLQITPDVLELPDTTLTFHKVLIRERPPRWNDFTTWKKLIEWVDLQMQELTVGAWKPVAVRFHPSIGAALISRNPKPPGDTLQDYLQNVPMHGWKVLEDFIYCRHFGYYSIVITSEYTGTPESYPVAIVFEPSAA